MCVDKKFLELQKKVHQVNLFIQWFYICVRACITRLGSPNDQRPFLMQLHHQANVSVWAWRHCKAVGGKGSVTDLITEVFVEEFMAFPMSAKNRMVGKSCV